MYRLLKWICLVLLALLFFSCNLFVTIVDNYISPPEETVIPEETVLPPPDSTETPTADPSETPTAIPTETPTPVSTSGPYELLYNNGSGSGWFGGDDINPRNVAYGQGIYIDTNIMITDFSFYFTSRFDYDYTPAGIGHAVTIRFTLRDSYGTSVFVQDVNVPDTFTGGWITWSNINWSAFAGETWIFSAYLLDGYNNMLRSYAAGDTSAGYTNGVRYVKTGTTDADMDSWSGWSNHSWDSWFWLQGYTQ